ncbi:hypothetical protein BV20DRAFT_87258 [Pilatotrama ljubarskyi]|nr:hypothetical protein BV20DRAFT_87258 [Pilatotrama ljubarskyi]
MPETTRPSPHSQPLHTPPVSRSAWFARALSMPSAHNQASAAASSTPLTTARPSSPESAQGAISGPSSYRPLYFRALRRSRDGGIRLAGGRPDDENTQRWTPAAYDDVLGALSESSTMPPSYAQYPSSASEA